MQVPYAKGGKGLTMLRESAIVFEDGNFWVLKNPNVYTVMQCNLTHSTAKQSFELSEDGLSLAVYYASYLSKRFPKLANQVQEN